MKDVCLSQLSREDRDKFKSKLLGVLNKLMEVCEANNIHWYVGFGACIGAIRHKGCIPWDDDIDVCMPRPDYDRFVEICKKTDLGDYELADIYDTPGYHTCVARLCDKNSTMCFRTVVPYVAGIFIDIFPVEGASDGNIKANWTLSNFWRFFCITSRLDISKSYLWKIIKKKDFLRFFLTTFVYLFKRPLQLQKLSLKMLEKTDRKYPYESSTCCVSYVGTYGLRNVFPKKWIEETIWVPFENTQVRIPKYYHEYLSRLYGDYMTPPPDNKKDDRHFVKYLDFEKRLTRDEILALLSE